MFVSSKRQVARVASTMAGLLLSAGILSAQDRPMVFAHGLKSSAQTWTGTANLVTTSYRVRAIIPNLPWSDSYGYQAGQLKYLLGGDTTQLVALGHSNGGIVLRETRRAGVGFSSIVTVGTPHQGAEMARSVRLALVDTFAVRYLGYMFDPWVSAPQPTDILWRYLFNRFYYSYTTWQNVFTLSRSFYTKNWYVLGEMEPGNGFLTGTLGQPNAAGSPESSIPSRVSIGVSAPSPHLGIIFSGIQPSYRTQAIAARTAMIAGYYLMADYYSHLRLRVTDPLYNAKRNAPAKFLLGGVSMLLWDTEWCKIIGTYQGPFSCAASDGVVPLSSQYWPGSNFVPATANGHTVETGASHLQQTYLTWGVVNANIPAR